MPTTGDRQRPPERRDPRLRRQGRRDATGRRRRRRDDRRGPARRLPAPRRRHARRLPARVRPGGGDRQYGSPDRRRRVLARVRRPRRRQPQRADLRHVSDGFVHAMRPERHRAPRLAGPRRRARLRRQPHRHARVRRRGEVSTDLGGAMLAVGRGRRRESRRRARGLRRRPRGQALRLGRRRASGSSPRRRTSPSPASRSSPFENVRYEGPERVQPHPARLHRLAGARRPRRRRRPARDRRRGDGPPPLRVGRRRLESPTRAGWRRAGRRLPGARRRPRPRSPRSTPTTHAITFNARRRLPRSRAGSSTRPRSATSTTTTPTARTSGPRSSSARTRSTTSRSNAGNVTDRRRFAPLEARQRPDRARATRASTRSTATGDTDGDPLLDADDAACPAGRSRLGIVTTGLLPVVGEGVTGYPVIGPVDLPERRRRPARRSARSPTTAPPTSSTRTASSCYGNGPDGPTERARVRLTAQPAAGRPPDPPRRRHPGLRRPRPGAGLVVPRPGRRADPRALDLALPEYQPTGQDYIAAWNTTTGAVPARLPADRRTTSSSSPGPSIADIDGLPGEEVLAGTASMDLNAYNAAGCAVARAGRS